jgi:molybdopterin-guanine dinucleotide biosynthesis protein A
MDSAGFVLAGGRSTRMGRDKALLPYRGSVLVDWIARQVRAAAGSAVIVGHPERYGALGWPVIGDLRPGCGPLAGIEAALAHSPADYNLIVACDLPGLSAPVLAELLAEAARCDCDCLVPASSGRLHEALCGVWRRRALTTVRRGLDEGIRSVAAVFPRLHLCRYALPGDDWMTNLNTPEDWSAHLAAMRDE